MRVHVFISGKVQGVFYRLSAKAKAEQLGLTGWVKNLADGRVEAVFEGKKDKINKMINWCWQGPARARVKSIEIKQEKEKNLKRFKILYFKDLFFNVFTHDRG